MSDNKLEVLSENMGELSGGSTALAEALVSVVIAAFVAGVIIMLLIVLGVIALFGSGSRGRPMGSAQYERQRRETDDMKEVGKPVQPEK